jgi:3-hydroxymyristoyl/3-hydroxydecanoyl-(acyl carrier protein) dehydratase
MKIDSSLQNHQILDIKPSTPQVTVSINFSVDLLSHFFENFFSSNAPLPGVLILECEPTLVICCNVAEFIRLHPLWQEQQLLALSNLVSWRSSVDW